MRGFSKSRKIFTMFVLLTFVMGFAAPIVDNVWARGSSSFSGSSSSSSRSSSSSSSSGFSSSRTSSSTSSGSGFSSSGSKSTTPSSSGGFFSSGSKSSDSASSKPSTGGGFFSSGSKSSSDTTPSKPSEPSKTTPSSSGGFFNSKGDSSNANEKKSTSAFSDAGNKAIGVREDNKAAAATRVDRSAPSYSVGNRTYVEKRVFVFDNRPSNWTPRTVIIRDGYNPTVDTLNLIYKLELIRAIQDVNERNRAMATLHADPRYAANRAEMDRLASENAELKTQLAAVDSTSFNDQDPENKKSSHWFLWTLLICAILGGGYWFLKRK